MFLPWILKQWTDGFGPNKYGKVHLMTLKILSYSIFFFLIWPWKFYWYLYYCDFLKVFGLMTKPLVRLLMPPSILNSNGLSSEPSSPKSSTLPLLRSFQDPESNTGDQEIHRPASLSRLLSTHTIHGYWRKYDDTYMRPLFGGRGFVLPVPGSPTDNGLH